ncbi:MAG: hypothetical protein K0M47_17305, partial [Rhizobium sp.]|nr:hypothetical protein [Rhizobium sp.]
HHLALLGGLRLAARLVLAPKVFGLLALGDGRPRQLLIRPGRAVVGGAAVGLYEGAVFALALSALDGLDRSEVEMARAAFVQRLVA